MLGSIGPLEIGIVLVIVLLVFGPKKLPELGRSAGKGLHEFKRGVNSLHERGGDPPAGEDSDPIVDSGGRSERVAG